MTGMETKNNPYSFYGGQNDTAANPYADVGHGGYGEMADDMNGVHAEPVGSDEAAGGFRLKTETSSMPAGGRTYEPVRPDMIPTDGINGRAGRTSRRTGKNTSIAGSLYSIIGGVVTLILVLRFAMLISRYNNTGLMFCIFTALMAVVQIVRAVVNIINNIRS